MFTCGGVCAGRLEGNPERVKTRELGGYPGARRIVATLPLVPIDRTSPLAV